MDNSISIQRLSTYRLPGETDNTNALKRYVWNIQLSQSLYPALSLVEVCIRNHLHSAIASKFGADWLTNQSVLLNDQEKQLREEIEWLKSLNKATATPDLIAKLSFGFWVSLFSSAYKSIYADGKILREAFPGTPSHFNTSDNLGKICFGIRNLRNRIFHHEPIFKIRDLAQKVFEIEELLRWMNPKALDQKNSLCNFSKTYWTQNPDGNLGHYGVVEYRPAFRTKIIDFLCTECSKLFGCPPENLKFKSDGALKYALNSKNEYTIRLAIREENLLGLLFLSKTAVQTIVVRSDSKDLGIEKWLLDFSKEKISSGPFVYCFENDEGLKTLLKNRGGSALGIVEHIDFEKNVIKYKI